MSATMWKAVLWSAGLVTLGTTAFAQAGGAQPLAVELANIRADLQLAKEEVKSLSLRLEQIERENAALKSAAGNASTYATVAQLNEAIADLSRAIKAGDAATAERAAAQIKKLGDATNAAFESLARTATASPVTPTFSTNYPQEGISYVVQKGDTVAVIARKTGARLQDILNANKIADPSKIQVGQTLFIPGGK